MMAWKASSATTAVPFAASAATEPERTATPFVESVQTATFHSAENPILSDEPYTPVLTLDPEPIETDSVNAPQSSESEDA